MKLTFKRIYEYGGDCKADDTDYICGYQASNGVMIEKKFADGLNVYCWKIGEDYYDTLNAAKNAVIRKANEEPAAPQEAANETETAATETPDEYAEARKLRARAYELRLRAENLNNEGKLHDDFVRYVEKLELQASEAVSRAYVAKNPRLAAALEKAKAKQGEHGVTEAADEPATDNKEEPKMTLKQLCDLTFENLDGNGGDIMGFAVYTDGGDTAQEFSDLRDVIKKYGNSEVEPVYIGGDEPASMTEPDAHGMIHVALVETETKEAAEDSKAAGQPAPQAGMTDEEKIDTLFHELAPMEGKADTVAG